MHPDIHYTRVSLGLTHCICNAAASLGMLNPEFAYGRVGIGKREIAAFRMPEGGGIEIQFETILLCPLNPTFKMLYLNLVAIHEFALEIADFVQIKPVTTGETFCK